MTRSIGSGWRSANRSSTPSGTATGTTSRSTCSSSSTARSAGEESALTIFVRDQGEGFDPETVANPLEPDNLLKSSGRGIFLIRNFMDEVHLQRAPEGGMEVRMVKRLHPAESPADPAPTLVPSSCPTIRCFCRPPSKRLFAPATSRWRASAAISVSTRRAPSISSPRSIWRSSGCSGELDRRTLRRPRGAGRGDGRRRVGSARAVLGVRSD